jgi:hypothetical protein
VGAPREVKVRGDQVDVTYLLGGSEKDLPISAITSAPPAPEDGGRPKRQCRTRVGESTPAAAANPLAGTIVWAKWWGSNWLAVVEEWETWHGTLHFIAIGLFLLRTSTLDGKPPNRLFWGQILVAEIERCECWGQIRPNRPR